MGGDATRRVYLGGGGDTIAGNPHAKAGMRPPAYDFTMGSPEVWSMYGESSFVSPPTLPSRLKAIKKLNDITLSYKINIDGKDNLIESAKALANKSHITLVCGLLFYAFTKATAQTQLRTDVLRHLGVFDKHHTSRDLLPKALRVRAEQVLVFEVAV